MHRHTYKHTHTYIHIDTLTYTLPHLHSHRHTYTHTHTLTYTQTHLHTPKHTDTLAHTQTERSSGKRSVTFYSLKGHIAYIEIKKEIRSYTQKHCLSNFFLFLIRWDVLRAPPRFGPLLVCCQSQYNGYRPLSGRHSGTR